jgi:hypothetical protein
LDIIKRVLGQDYMEHQIERLVYEEEFATGKSKVRLVLVPAQGGETCSVEGEGVGVVDATLHALFSRFAPEYHSLESIQFIGFEVRAKLDTKQQHAGSDAVGEVTLDVRNSEGKQFHFADSSRSVVSSASRAVLAAIEYFVNAERAYITLYRALKDARERDRHDLVTRYTRELAEVVKSTSYTEVIDKIRKELS